MLVWCRAVRTRRFQTLSTQDLCQFLIVGVLSGLFWLQRAQSDTTAAAADTLGGFLLSWLIPLSCLPCMIVKIAEYTGSGLRRLLQYCFLWLSW